MATTASQQAAQRSEAAWLGLDYTPITPEAKANIKKLWGRLDLPATSFDHWSTEYTREIWGVAVEMLKDDSELDRETVLGLLTAMDVWTDDPADQQWAPK